MAKVMKSCWSFVCWYFKALYEGAKQDAIRDAERDSRDE